MIENRHIFMKIEATLLTHDPIYYFRAAQEIDTREQQPSAKAKGKDGSTLSARERGRRHEKSEMKASSADQMVLCPQ